MKFSTVFYILAFLMSLTSLATKDVQLLAIGLLCSILGILTESKRKSS